MPRSSGHLAATTRVIVYNTDVTAHIAVLTNGTDAKKTEATRELYALSVEANKKREIRMAGGIAPLIALLTGTDDHKKNAARTLASLAAHDADNKTAICEAGGIAPLIVLLEGTDKQKVAAAAALGSLAVDATIRTAIGARGGIRPLVALLSDPDAPSSAGTNARLPSVKRASSADKWKQSAATAAMTFLSPILSPTKLIADEQKSCASCALANLARDKSNQTLIREAGGIDPLIKLLRIGNEVQQTNAACTLGDLALDMTNQTAIHECGGIAPLVALVRSDINDLKTEAARALGLLAQHKTNKVAIGKAGAIPPLIAMLGRSSTGAQKTCSVVALGNLATEASNAVAIRKLGGVAPLVAMLRPMLGRVPALNDSHGASDAYASHTTCAAQTVWTLASDAASRAAIREAGGIPPLVALVKNGTDVQKQVACGALLDLAADETNQVAIRDAGAIPPLATLVSAGTEEQKMYASLVLAKLQESAAVSLCMGMDLATAEANLRVARDASAVLFLRDGMDRADTDAPSLLNVNHSESVPVTRDTPGGGDRAGAAASSLLNVIRSGSEEAALHATRDTTSIDSGITREGAAAALRVAIVGFDVQALSAALAVAQIESVDGALVEAGVMRLSLLENAPGASGASLAAGTEDGASCGEIAASLSVDVTAADATSAALRRLQESHAALEATLCQERQERVAEQATAVQMAGAAAARLREIEASAAQAAAEAAHARKQVGEYHRRLLEMATALTLSNSASAALAQAPRFVAAPQAFVTGEASDATLGVAHYLCIADDELRARMNDGIDAMRREFTEHVRALRNAGNRVSVDRAGVDEMCMTYVLDQEAGSLARLFQHEEHLMMDCNRTGALMAERLNPTTGRGMVLADFVNHADAQEARLTPAHVAALRLYTSAAYNSINGPLRDVSRFREGRPHPLAATVAFIDEAARRLKRVSSHRPHANEPRPLYRGMRNIEMPEAFLRNGGIELAPMSATFDLDTAMHFATGGARATVMRIHNLDWTERGADLRFLSCYPNEEESLYAPLAFLRCRAVDGPPPTVETAGGVTFSVLDVETRQLT